MNTSSTIFGMFGRSPIRPLQEHMAKAHSCTEKLLPFVTALQEEAWDRAKQLQQDISRLEHDADDLKKDIRLHLPKGLFLPVPRNDLLELLYGQDRVANRAEDIAGLMFGRKIKIPALIEDLFQQFLARTVDASAQANKAISELDSLLETGFRGKEATLVEAMITELDKIEHDTDTLQVKIRQIMFDHEKNLPPIEVMFLYKVIEWVGDLADRAQQVGGRLQLLLAH